jgi:hypothetical protein
MARDICGRGSSTGGWTIGQAEPLEARLQRGNDPPLTSRVRARPPMRDASVVMTGALRMRRGFLEVLRLLESPLDPLQFVDQGGALRAEGLRMIGPVAALLRVAHAVRPAALVVPLMPHVARPAH